MDQPDTPSVDTNNVPQPASQAPGLGLSAVELAAQRGIGPLSPLASEAWHGQSRPCVSCGQLVRRTATACDQCGQDLGPRMLWTMQKHAGPWYVLEHVRPFPGVKLERLIRQIQRGVLTATTIVRGPTTFGQWRYAAETPGLSKHLGLCWRCQEAVTEEDTICRACRVNLDGITDVFFDAARPESDEADAGPIPVVPKPAPPAPTIRFAEPTPNKKDDPADPPSVGEAIGAELGRLSAAVSSDESPGPAWSASASNRIAGIHVGWIIASLIAVLIMALCLVVWLRSRELSEKNEIPSASAVATSPVVARIAGGTQ